MHFTYYLKKLYSVVNFSSFGYTVMNLNICVDSWTHQHSQDTTVPLLQVITPSFYLYVLVPFPLLP